MVVNINFTVCRFLTAHDFIIYTSTINENMYTYLAHVLWFHSKLADHILLIRIPVAAVMISDQE